MLHTSPYFFINRRTASSSMSSENSLFHKNGREVTSFDDWLNTIYKQYEQRYILDLTKCEGGTYYFSLPEGVYAESFGKNDEKLHIYIKKDQKIVFNIPDSNVNLKKFMISIDGGQLVGSDRSDISADEYVKSVVWNLYNASTVNLSGIFGMVLAPNANVTIGTTSTGWLVCNKLASNAGEWHGVWQGMPPSEIPNGFQLTARKTVNGVNTPTAEEQFTFTLSKLDENGQEAVIQTKKNNGETITFDTINVNTAGE